MSSIDERIVAMKFDNAKFEKNIADSNKSLSDLKKNLNFDNVKANLSDLGGSVKMGGLDALGRAVDGLKGNFTGLEAVAVGALLSIGAKATELALGAVKNLATSITQSARDGFREYELQINAVQTILSNTARHGTGIKEVNAALEELNEYADKTIYNFSNMTQAIGTFTVAGIKLEDATAAVKGFSNMAALSGASAGEAAGAMGQLAQAMNTGTVRLQDWISIENRGIAGVEFQEALKTTARAHGVAVDDIISKSGSFRASLSEDWLTAEIMTQTLAAATGDLSKEQLIQMGYSAEQADQMLDLAKRAGEAATVVKTLSQVFDTYGEAVGSGWAKSWQIIFGDFEEAKGLFTEVSNIMNGLAGDAADARNEQLQIWKDMGGREAIVDALRNAFKALMSIITPITDAFREVFPPSLGKNLAAFSFWLRDVTAAMILSEGQSSALGSTFKFIFSVIKLGLDIVGGLIGLLLRLFGVIFSGGDDVDLLGAQIGAFFDKLSSAIKDTAWISAFFTKVGDVLATVVGFLKDFAVWAALSVASLGGFASEGAEIALTRIRERLESILRFGDKVVEMWNNIKAAFAKVAKFLQPITDAFGEMFSDIGANIKEAFADVNFDDVIDLVNVGLLGGLVLLFKKFVNGGFLGNKVSDGILAQFGEITGKLGGILDGLTGTLEAMQQNLQAGTLMKIATAIALLAAAVLVLSLIDSAKLTSALVALTVMFTQLMGAMAVFSKIAAGPGIAQLPIMAAGMILIAIAINILVSAVRKLSELEWPDLIKGLVGVTGLLLAMAGAVKLMSGNAAGMISTGIGLIAVAVAVKILASAVKDFSGMDWGAMVQGLVGVAGTLVALGLFSKIASVSKGAVASGVGLILIATAIKIIASAVSDIGGLDLGAMIQGLIGLNVMLATIIGFLSAFSNASPKMILFATGLILVGAAIKVFASAVSDFGTMPIETLATGLIAMALALGIIAGAMLLMPPTMLASAAALVIMSVALNLIGDALKKMGGMSWEEIGKSMVVLAGSLIILAGAMYLMTGALPGAAALLIVSAALAIFTPALIAMSQLSWDEIGRGLTMLAGVFGVIGLAALVLAPVTPIILALGIAIGLIGLGIGVAAAGMLGIAVALGILAVAGVAAIPVLVALFTAVIGLIPLLVQKIGEGIVAMAKVIGEAAPVFLEAAVALIMTLLEAIQTLAPEIIDTLLVLIDELLRGLVEAVPKMVDAGMKLIIGILDGISKNIGKLITAGTDVIVKFVEGIGNNAHRVVAAAGNAILSFINGLSSYIENNTWRFIAAGNRLVRAIVEGISQAIENSGNLMRWAGERIGSAVVEGAKNFLGINSPSKVFRDYIMGAVFEGVDDGTDNGLKDAVRAGGRIGDAVIAGTSKSIAGIASAVASDMDFQPTIRPVLDLSAIKKDSGLIGGMLRPPTMKVDDSYMYASQLSLQQRANNQPPEDDDGGTDDDAPRGAIIFKQYNSSPKALSEAEVYRNTKNLLSVAKGELEP